ncbi:anaerobic dimethyl sulfoxide reductase chain B [Clostridium aceticum]|uniref:Anaerobic dimethyl sulfoxide reductase chain B n=1 Tax=Clostridium aceticum TaxID=84022 RepID=A0A0D8IDN5_9CLOT|nr:4Fe-4S dicluster domain-containing protein [Clostridium aceticum]AKL94356.1 anaerobic dimethyl sulfoxide reductase chain B [Clostridium aceticum]KJF28410.1 4Fe-4S ferredoxin [Clostridium aceticum]
MRQKGFFFNMEKCSQCKSCVIACKDKNNLEVGANFRHVDAYEGGKFPNPWMYFISLSCNHCENPICVKNCPTGAMTKRIEDGIVYVNTDKCAGCQRCVKSCPYGAPQYRKELKKTSKCDMCYELTDAGEEPVCISACNMRALECKDIGELRKISGTTADVRGLADSKLTNPSLVIKPKKEAFK